MYIHSHTHTHEYKNTEVYTTYVCKSTMGPNRIDFELPGFKIARHIE